MAVHKPGSASGKAAGDTRRETRTQGKATRVAAAEKQMERKPFENGG